MDEKPIINLDPARPDPIGPLLTSLASRLPDSQLHKLLIADPNRLEQLENALQHEAFTPSMFAIAWLSLDLIRASYPSNLAAFVHALRIEGYV